MIFINSRHYSKGKVYGNKLDIINEKYQTQTQTIVDESDQLSRHSRLTNIQENQNRYNPLLEILLAKEEEKQKQKKIKTNYETFPIKENDVIHVGCRIKKQTKHNKANNSNKKDYTSLSSKSNICITLNNTTKNFRIKNRNKENEKVKNSYSKQNSFNYLTTTNLWKNLNKNRNMNFKNNKIGESNQSETNETPLIKNISSFILTINNEKEKEYNSTITNNNKNKRENVHKKDIVSKKYINQTTSKKVTNPTKNRLKKSSTNSNFSTVRTKNINQNKLNLELNLKKSNKIDNINKNINEIKINKIIKQKSNNIIEINRKNTITNRTNNILKQNNLNNNKISKQCKNISKENKKNSLISRNHSNNILTRKNSYDIKIIKKTKTNIYKKKGSKILKGLDLMRRIENSVEKYYNKGNL